MKIHPMEASLSMWTDRNIERQRDMTKLMVAFLNFANPPKNVHRNKTSEG